MTAAIRKRAGEQPGEVVLDKINGSRLLQLATKQVLSLGWTLEFSGNGTYGCEWNLHAVANRKLHNQRSQRYGTNSVMIDHCVLCLSAGSR